MNPWYNQLLNICTFGWWSWYIRRKACRLITRGLASGLTLPSRAWFKLTPFPECPSFEGLSEQQIEEARRTA